MCCNLDIHITSILNYLRASLRKLPNLKASRKVTSLRSGVKVGYEENHTKSNWRSYSMVNNSLNNKFYRKKQANKSKDITLEMCMKSNTLDLSKNTTLSEICKKMFTDIRKKAEEINK